jgi:non-haem Fe2+, alpha-ketoglutarate-dependent halogenase
MNKALTDEQVAAWNRDGFLYPFPLLSESERQECLDGLARFEGWLGSRVNESRDLKWRTMPHITLPWVHKLATDPRILDIVEDLIGPDIAIYTCTFFIKESNTPTLAAWHQDSTYWGLETPIDAATAWVALTEASPEAGCMDVLPYENGKPHQYRHRANVVKNSVNRASQVITDPLDESRVETMALKAGEFSLHHGQCTHRSGPNAAGHRRIGMGINYVPAWAKPIGKYRTAGMLVRGEDRWGYLEPLSPPKAELDADAIAAHEMAVTRYRETYLEQEPLHEKMAS